LLSTRMPLKPSPFTTESNRTYDKEKDQINNQLYY
jgi:hypothetical protein